VEKLSPLARFHCAHFA